MKLILLYFYFNVLSTTHCQCCIEERLRPLTSYSVYKFIANCVKIVEGTVPNSISTSSIDFFFLVISNQYYFSYFHTDYQEQPKNILTGGGSGALPRKISELELSRFRSLKSQKAIYCLILIIYFFLHFYYFLTFFLYRKQFFKLLLLLMPSQNVLGYTRPSIAMKTTKIILIRNGWRLLQSQRN